MKNTPSAVSASDPGPGGEPLGKQAHEMAENVLKASRTESTKPVPTSGWVFFLAGSNSTHPSVSQSYPIPRGTEWKPSLKEMVGPRESPSDQNLNPNISTIQEGLKVSLWMNGCVDRWAKGG